MKRAAFFLAVAIGFVLVGTANAGIITATYDLAGSTLTTKTALGTDLDQITGTVTIRYGAATIGAPISWASVTAGNVTTTINQNYAGLIVLNGSTTTTVTGPNWGFPIGAATIVLPQAAPGTITGSIHCTGGYCGYAGFPVSTPLPQTGPSQLALAGGGIVYTSGQAGLGNWAGAPLTVVSPGVATLSFAYVGSEISRSFIPEPGTASLLGLGLVALAGAGSFKRRFRTG